MPTIAPAKPEPPAPTQDKGKKRAVRPENSLLPSNTEEALRAAEIFRLATMELADAHHAGVGPAEIDVLERARMAAEADFLDKTPSDAALTWPQLSKADEDYLYAYCEEVRGQYSTGAGKSVQDLGVDLDHSVHSTIFESEARNLAQNDDNGAEQAKTSTRYVEKAEQATT